MTSTLVRGPLIGWPAIMIVPVVINSSPAHIIRSVLFPHPLGPRTATNCPLATSKSAFAIASMVVFPVS